MKMSFLAKALHCDCVSQIFAQCGPLAPIFYLVRPNSVNRGRPIKLTRGVDPPRPSSIGYVCFISAGQARPSPQTEEATGAPGPR